MAFLKGELNPAKQERIRKLLREQKLGDKNPMFGKKQSRELIEKRVSQFRGKPRSEETRRKIGLANSIANKGKKHSEEHRRKISQANKGRKGEPWSKEMRESISGENNHNWKGGITPLHKAIRQSFEYKLWRTAVFERDGYKCIWCELKGGWSKELKKAIKLNADHIKPFSLFPELRFAIDNGRTLCFDCHATTETYGVRLLVNYNKKNV